MTTKDKLIGITAVFVIIFGVFFLRCSSTEEPQQPEAVKDDPSFSQDIQPIFSASCALSNCHNSTAQAGLELSAGRAYSNLVNVDSTEVPSLKRVLPNDAANSYLVHKIEGNQAVGDRMPQGRTPLSSAKIQNIKNWIIKGAKNN